MKFCVVIRSEGHRVANGVCFPYFYLYCLENSLFLWYFFSAVGVMVIELVQECNLLIYVLPLKIYSVLVLFFFFFPLEVDQSS